MTDASTISSLNAMDATGLRAFAKEHGIKVTSLPNVKPETLRTEITTELEKREANTVVTTAVVDTTTATTATTASQQPVIEATTATATVIEASTTAVVTQDAANGPAADAQNAGQQADTSDASQTADAVSTVRMVRTDIATGDEHFADVHPDEVQNYADHGYLEASTDGEA